MITDIFDKDIVKILTFFSISPGSNWSRKEIQEKTVLNNVPLDSALQNLLNNQFLKKEKRVYGFNFEHEEAKKMFERIKKEHQRCKEIPLNIYFAILDFSFFISNKKNVKQIYLFGSYAKLIYTDKSDIDLAIILEKDNTTLKKEIMQYVKKLEKKYNKIIELHFFIAKDMQNKDPLIKEIQRNSITLF